MKSIKRWRSLCMAFMIDNKSLFEEGVLLKELTNMCPHEIPLHILRYFICGVCDVKQCWRGHKRCYVLRDDWLDLAGFECTFEITYTDASCKYAYIPFTHNDYYITTSTPWKVYKSSNNKEVKQRTLRSKYIQLELGSRTVLLHHIVALTFVPNDDIESFDIVDHIDTNRSNNKLSNLRWTNSYINGLNKCNAITLTSKRVIERLIPIEDLYTNPDGSPLYYQDPKTLRVYANMGYTSMLTPRKIVPLSRRWIRIKNKSLRGL